MHKEIIITVIIVILIIVLNVITQDYTQDTAEIMQSKLEEIKVDLEAGKEIKDIEEKLKKTIEEWNNRKNILAYYLEHDEIEKIETELTALNANILSSFNLSSINSCMQFRHCLLNNITKSTKCKEFCKKI